MSFYRLGEVFRWFVARVVNIQDEKQLGRVQIRVIHDQTGELGSKSGKLGGVLDKDLLWAWPISAIQSASLHHTKITELEEFQVPEFIDAVGLSPTGIAVGTYVYGFYLDGHEKNIPLIFGTYHKMSVFPEPPSDETGAMLQVPIEGDYQAEIYNDVAKLARGEQTLPKDIMELGEVIEPNSAYAAAYPYNLTYTSKGGHAIEIDDTPGEERLHIYHKTGSYEEINSEGRRVVKSVHDNYSIGTHSNFFAYQINEVGEIGVNQNIHIGNTRSYVIDKDDNLTVGNNQVIDIGDNQTVSIGNDCTITVGRNCTIIVQGDADISVSGDTNLQTGGSMNIESGGSMNISAGGTMDLSAPTININ